MSNKKEIENCPPFGLVLKKQGVAMDSAGPTSVPAYPMLPISPGGEVKELATRKPAVQRIGEVSLRALDGNRWTLRWTCPATRRDIRRTITGTPKDAQKACSHINSEIMAGKGFAPACKPAGPSIKDTIATWIRLSQASDVTKKDYGARAACFVKWLVEHYPAIETFSDLRAFHLQEYVAGLIAKGLAPNSIRLRIIPVRGAWSFAVENWPETVRAVPKVRLPTRSYGEPKVPDPNLVSPLLGWLHKPETLDLWCMVTLIVTCGLRVLECVHLRRCDIDLQRGVIEVVDTPSHKLKNPSSRRTLPICGEARVALMEWLDAQRVSTHTGEVFLTSEGRLWNAESIGHRWSRKPAEIRDTKWMRSGGVAYRAADDLNLPEIAKITIHDFRKCLATWAPRLGASREVVQRYLGHSPSDVMGRFYQRIGQDELTAVSRCMETWRNLAEEPVERQNSGNHGGVISITG